MEKYQNKYRIQSHRMPEWDYAGNGVYFLTIVTQYRICNLGKINNGKMELSDFGKIVETEFLKSFEIRHELFLDEYIIMPNHLHAIIILNKSGNATHGTHGTHGTHVETHGRASLQSPQQSPQQFLQQKMVRLPKSISSFLAGFKSSVNTKIDDYIDDYKLDIPKYNRNNHFFQPNYYDRIIRNKSEYERIKKYIINNPANWINDKFKPENK